MSKNIRFINRDNQLKVGIYRGCSFVISKGNGRGYRNGYVGLDKTHPWSGLDYTEVDNLVLDSGKFGRQISFSEIINHQLYVGFTCDHITDKPDPEIMAEWHLNQWQSGDMHVATSIDPTPVTNDDVETMCKELIDIALEAKAKNTEPK